MKFKNPLLATAFLLVMSCTAKKTDTSQPGEHEHQDSSLNYADSVNAGSIPVDTLKRSPIRVAMANVGNNHVHIRYGSPGVRGRILWGGLVAYDQVWVTGAHQATAIYFSKDVIIGEKKIRAGKYAFFTIPGKETWTLIINKNWNQHLADKYSQADDLVRVIVTPKAIDKPVQRLTYSIESKSATEGAVLVQWEKIKIVLPFKNEN